MTDYSHCPDDIREAIDEYEANVQSGVIQPWNPATRDEYDTTDRATKDMWLSCFLASKLPPELLGYMLIVKSDDKSVTMNQARYLTAPKMLSCLHIYCWL